jgi:hypothetical protein
MLDITVGAHAVVGNSVFTLGYAIPVTQERVFEGELRCFLNYRF